MARNGFSSFSLCLSSEEKDLWTVPPVSPHKSSWWLNSPSRAYWIRRSGFTSSWRGLWVLCCTDEVNQVQVADPGASFSSAALLLCHLSLLTHQRCPAFCWAGQKVPSGFSTLRKKTWTSFLANPIETSSFAFLSWSCTPESPSPSPGLLQWLSSCPFLGKSSFCT